MKSDTTGSAGHAPCRVSREQPSAPSPASGGASSLGCCLTVVVHPLHLVFTCSVASCPHPPRPDIVECFFGGWGRGRMGRSSSLLKITALQKSERDKSMWAGGKNELYERKSKVKEAWFPWLFRAVPPSQFLFLLGCYFSPLPHFLL